MENSAKAVPVMVALRSRPLIQKELNEGCQICLQTIPGEPQVILGKDRAFTYDFTFGPNEPQVDVYEKACSKLVESAFKGYNATILAYGQTGSGKTFTMGGYEASLECDEDAMGVIPRIVREVFQGMQSKEDAQYDVRVSYMEIYNEELRDLLGSSSSSTLSIREEGNGEIKIHGLKEIPVTSFEGTMAMISKGANCRTTGATAMNNTSSRSHAVFTLHIDKKSDIGDVSNVKFHMVDLAGSERIKRTHAEGERLREGININKGLLALGNVISALGEENQQKRQHIPYRDSKLTRILQDSLGGNSHTLMIACVSPADSNIEETLNTLRYADRARKIKNKPIINRDPQAAEMMRLKTLVQNLQSQLYGSGNTLKDSTNTNLTASTNTSMLLPPFNNDLDNELRQLRERVKEVEEENTNLTKQLQNSVAQSSRTLSQLMRLEASNEQLKLRLTQVKENMGIDVDLLSSTINTESNPQAKAELEKIRKLTDSINVSSTPIEEDDDMEDEDNSDGKENEDGSDEHTNPKYKEITQKHTIRQAELQRELGELNQILSTKQALAEKIEAAEAQMQDMKMRYDKMLQEYEAKTSQLEKEKEELTSDLHNAKRNVKASAVSEQRRLRMKELETQMAQLKKAMSQQNKVLKMKESSDKQMGKLGSEILALKQTRVKLMKQMKEEASSYQKWKKEKEKEVAKMQLKDRKREVEVSRMKKQFEQQQAVQKRRNEEVLAANKRLLAALSKQKEVEAERTSKQAKYEASSIGNRVRKWLSHELEVKVSMREAQYHLDQLIEDRKQLTQRLNELKDKLERGPLADKFSFLGNNKDEDQIYPVEKTIKEQIEQTQLNIDLINPQIQELQQKLVDADQDTKGVSTWQSLHTISEAKCAMKFLLEQAINARTDYLKAQGELRNAHDMGQEEVEQLKEAKAMISQWNAKYNRDIQKLEIEHNKKVLSLYCDLGVDSEHIARGKGADKVYSSLVKSANDNMRHIEELEKKLQTKEAEYEELLKYVKLNDPQNSTLRLLPEFLSEVPEPKVEVKPAEIKTDAQVKAESEDAKSLNSTFNVEGTSNEQDESGDDQDTFSTSFKRKSSEDPQRNTRPKKPRRTLLPQEITGSFFEKLYDV